MGATMDTETFLKQSTRKTRRSLLAEARRLRKRGILLDLNQIATASEKATLEQIAALKSQGRAILDKAKSESRPLTQEERDRFDGLKNKIAQLNQQLEDDRAMEGLDGDRGGSGGLANGGQDPRQAVRPAQAGFDPGGSNLAPDYIQRLALPRSQRYSSYVSHSGRRMVANVDDAKDLYLSGLFYAVALFGHEGSRQKLLDAGYPRQALSVGTNTAGGFLTPDETAAQIVKLRDEYGVIRSVAQITTMASDTKNQPKRSGGVTATFTAENAAITDTNDPAWANVALVAKKLAAIVRVSTELSEDSLVDIGAEITDELAYAFAVREDQVCFVGDGSAGDGNITGIANALLAGSKVVGVTGEVGFDTISLGTCRKLISRVKRYKGAQLAWYIHSTGYSELMQRLLDAGGGNSNVTLANGSPMLQFLGYPVILVNALPGVSGSNVNKVVALFGDLRSGTLFGTRRQIEFASSVERYFELDQIGFRATERFDFKCHETGTGSVPGGIMCLQTAAS